MNQIFANSIENKMKIGNFYYLKINNKKISAKLKSIEKDGNSYMLIFNNINDIIKKRKYNKNIFVSCKNNSFYSIHKIRSVKNIFLISHDINETYIYRPIRDNIILRKILNDPNFIWI
jgi:hypothetical protein